MSSPRLHFLFKPGDQPAEVFAKKFARGFKQTQFDKADTIVTIGGDGTLLYAFHRAASGQKIFGMTTPSSTSRGFWTNHGIATRKLFEQALAAAEGFKIHPLKADIQYEKGHNIIRAFNDVIPSDNSGQALLMNLTLNTGKKSVGPIRVMGGGLIVATAFGSTAINQTFMGPAVDIRNSGFILTSKGTYAPVRGMWSVVANDATSVDIQFPSARRSARIDYDGQSLNSEEGNLLQGLTIAKDKKHFVELLLTEDPSVRAYAMLTGPKI